MYFMLDMVRLGSILFNKIVLVTSGLGLKAGCK